MRVVGAPRSARRRAWTSKAPCRARTPMVGELSGTLNRSTPDVAFRKLIAGLWRTGVLFVKGSSGFGKAGLGGRFAALHPFDMGVVGQLFSHGYVDELIESDTFICRDFLRFGANRSHQVKVYLV